MPEKDTLIQLLETIDHQVQLEDWDDKFSSPRLLIVEVHTLEERGDENPLVAIAISDVLGECISGNPAMFFKMAALEALTSAKKGDFAIHPNAKGFCFIAEGWELDTPQESPLPEGPIKDQPGAIEIRVITYVDFDGTWVTNTRPKPGQIDEVWEDMRSQPSTNFDSTKVEGPIQEAFEAFVVAYSMANTIAGMKSENDD